MPQVSYQIVSSVSLSSSYTAYTYNDGSHSTSTPSTGSANYGFSYAAAGIPAGSTINSAVFRVESFGSPLHGTAIRGVRVNGTDVTDSIPSATDVDIKPYLTTGDNTITLRFKSGTSNTSYPSNPPTTDPNDRTNSSSLAFNDVKVVINYTPPYTAPSVSVVRLNGTTSVQYGAASSSMTLSWEAANGSYNAISSYSVYRSVNGGAYSLLQAGISSTSLSVTLPGTAGQRHQYYVIAIGEYSNSAAAYSPQVYAYSSPTAPTAVSISPTSVSPGASVSLSWSGATAGVGVPISSYSIRRSTTSGGTYTEVDTSTSTSKSFAAPSTAGTYYYKILTYGGVSGYNSGVSSVYATLTVTNPRSTFTLNRTTLPMDNSTQITATISASGSAYTHTVRWYINGTYTQTNSKAAGVTSDTFKAPLNWNGAFPSSTSGICYCLLTTLSGGVEVGTYSLSFSVTVPSTIVPSASINVTAVNGFGSYFLKGITSATATVTASGSQGSSIDGYSVSGGGYSGSSATLNTGILNNLGDNVFSVTVTDSRGRTATASQIKTVTNYAKPVISAVSCYRSDSGKNPLADGTCITVGATFAITSLTGNAITVKQAQYRQSGASSWSTATTLTSGATSVIATGVSIAYAYEVLITLRDTVGQTSTYQTSIMPSAKLFDFRNDRAALGRIAATANRFMLPPGWGFEYQGQVIGVPSNPNLLINGNFRNFVNQRAAYDYNVTGKYTVDRWLLTVTAGSTGYHLYADPNGYIELRAPTSGGTSYLIQRVEDPKSFVGYYTLTFYAKIAAGGTIGVYANNGETTLGYVNFYADGSGYKAYSTTVYLDGTQTSSFFAIAALPGSIVDIMWAKVEVGGIATPFVPRSYAEELAMCQRYTTKLVSPASVMGVGGVSANGTPIYLSFAIPTAMRVTPSLINDSSGAIYLRGKNGQATNAGTVYTMYSICDGSVIVSFPNPNTTLFPAGTNITGSIENCKLLLDAEIY